MTSFSNGSSLSKGVFVFKGTKTVVNAADYVDAGAGDVGAGAGGRSSSLTLFSEAWRAVDDTLQDLERESSERVFSELTHFTRCAHSASSRTQPEAADLAIRPTNPDVLTQATSRKTQLRQSAIPTAAFVTGVNVTDHAALFASLAAALRRDATPHVALLRSALCPSLKAALGTIIAQLTHATEMSEHDDSDEVSGVTRQVRRPCTMSSIVAWYNALHHTDPASLHTDPASLKPHSLTVQSSDHGPPPKSWGLQSDLAASDGGVGVLGSPKRMRFASPPRASPVRASPRRPAPSVTDPPGASDPLVSPGASVGARRKLIARPEFSSDPKLTSPAKRKGGVILCDDLGGQAAEMGVSGSTGGSVGTLAYSVPPGGSVEGVGRSMGGLKPVVVMVEDFESFPPHVLQDLISICGHYAAVLPLVLLFGVATSVGAVHQSLPCHVTSLLAMQAFHAPLSSDYLTRVIERVLLSPHTWFKLGRRTFDFLLDTFLFHDFSVVNFVSALKWCMLEHYVALPEVTQLCVRTADIERQVTALTHKQLDAVRATVSFRRHVESLPPAAQIFLLEDDAHARGVVIRMLHAVHALHSTLPPALRALHALTAHLPHAPLGKLLRELYSLCLSTNVCETPDYQHALDLVGGGMVQVVAVHFRAFSRDELSAVLERVIGHLGSHLGDHLVPALPHAADLSVTVAELQRLSAHLGALAEGTPTVSDTLLGTDPSTEPRPIASLPSRLNLATLKQTLKAQDAVRRPVAGVYQQLRAEIITVLDTQVFRKYLVTPASLPLHECLYYGAVERLKRHLSAAPRAHTQRALNQPSLYLQSAALTPSASAGGEGWQGGEEGEIPASLPDLCIAYKLHLECGRLINLYDWMQAFAAVLESQGSTSPDNNHTSADTRTTRKQIDRTVHARFIRAVSELQVLGFVRHTRRKTDHVARLTWGC